jgi:hypothetical protein
MFGSRLVLAPCSLLSRHPEQSEGSAFRSSTLHALSVSTLRLLALSPPDFKHPRTFHLINWSFRTSPHQYHSMGLTLPLFSYSYALFCSEENAIPTLFSIFRTLWQKHPGWGLPPSSQKPTLFCLGPRLFWNWHLRKNPGPEVLSFRPIRVGQPILAVLFPFSPVTDHGSRTTSRHSQITKSNRIRTYKKRGWGAGKRGT